MPQPSSDIIIYQNHEGSIKVDVRLEDETVWLTQSQPCALFQKSKATISEHVKHIFEEGELDEKVVVRKFRTTTQHDYGQKQELEESAILKTFGISEFLRKTPN